MSTYRLEEQLLEFTVPMPAWLDELQPRIWKTTVKKIALTAKILKKPPPFCLFVVGKFVTHYQSHMILFCLRLNNFSSSPTSQEL